MKIGFDKCYTLSKVHGVCDGSCDPLHGHMVVNMPIIVEWARKGSEARAKNLSGYKLVYTLPQAPGLTHIHFGFVPYITLNTALATCCN